MLSEMFGKSSNFSIRDVQRLKIIQFTKSQPMDYQHVKHCDEEDFGNPEKLCQWFPKIFYINENNIFLPNILFTRSHFNVKFYRWLI